MAIDRKTGAQLLSAVGILADRGVMGLVVLDGDLVVTARHGSQVESVEVGAPITDSLIPLIGSEDYILGFKDDPALSLELPGVVIIKGPDSSERFNLSLFYDADGERYLLFVARSTLDSTLEVELVRHVRARLIAEADTNLKARELVRANRDLEQFAAIVSHDLKAPMRALQYLMEDAEAAAAAGDHAATLAQLALVKQQAKRMSGMLSGLLDYSSVGRKATALELVDTRQIAQSIAQSIGHGTGIAVTVAGDWPVVTNLAAPFDLVIRNLVDNAVKHHDRDRGSVVISCAEEGEDLVVSVSDDGPGIAVEHRAAIFLPFRTLTPGDGHGRDGTSGAGRGAGLGLGLALVQRTLDSVGGRISLTPPSADGRGTTFEVRWPKVIATQALLA